VRKTDADGVFVGLLDPIVIFIKVLSTTSRSVPYSTDHGRQWRTPEKPIPHPQASQRAAPGRYGLSLVGAIGWSGAGSER